MSRTETEASDRHPRSRTAKRCMWRGLRQRWRMLGLFEIDTQHEFYGLTGMMKEGLSAAVQDAVDGLPLNELSEEDFKMEVTKPHKGFQMQTFAGPVFSYLRRSLGITDREYQQSLSSRGYYLQFISNSKSKATFFLTNDKRFFLKTQSKREARFLLSNLRTYMNHLESYPHSLLVRFLGVHRLKIPHEKEKYFIVMQSVFYPDERISARYDIKGCEVNRWTDPGLEKSQCVVVLKDMNFEGNHISLGHQRSWLIRQVEIDTAFLLGMNVLDYSLLLAYQPLHQDELERSNSFATVIMRAKKSMNPGSGPSHANHPTVLAVEESAALLVSNMTPEPDLLCATGGGNLISLEEIQSQLQGFQTQNRRLLPDFKNPVHVIDGSELRYFVGIIDIFTVYGFWKKLEYLWKSLRYPGKAFSTASPLAYSRRLCQWVQDHTK